VAAVFKKANRPSLTTDASRYYISGALRYYISGIMLLHPSDYPTISLRYISETVRGTISDLVP